MGGQLVLVSCYLRLTTRLVLINVYKMGHSALFLLPKVYFTNFLELEASVSKEVSPDFSGADSDPDFLRALRNIKGLPVGGTC